MCGSIDLGIDIDDFIYKVESTLLHVYEVVIVVDSVNQGHDTPWPMPDVIMRAGPHGLTPTEKAIWEILVDHADDNFRNGLINIATNVRDDDGDPGEREKLIISEGECASPEYGGCTKQHTVPQYPVDGGLIPITISRKPLRDAAVFACEEKKDPATARGIR